jgi:hypothetical protein
MAPWFATSGSVASNLRFLRAERDGLCSMTIYSSILAYYVDNYR